MYRRPGRDWPAVPESIESVRDFAHMFENGCKIRAAEQRGDPYEEALDLYNLAYVFWTIGGHLANADLSEEERAELCQIIASAERTYKAHFPDFLPRRRIRQGFDGLRFLIAVEAAPGCDRPEMLGRARIQAWCRADWLRNSLHNAYLDQKAGW